MEFSALIDQLEDVLTNAKKGRLRGDVRVDKQEISALVARLRGAIPDELKQANWIGEKRDEMLTEAKRETAEILEEAHEERARLLGTEEIAKAAQERADQLLGEARAREREIRLSAEEYAGDILASLETFLAKLAEGVDRGRGRLADRGGDRAVERGRDRAAGREAALVG